MGNPKGGLFERNLLDYLRKAGYDVERLRLAGKEDEGDLVVRGGGLYEVIEAKDVARWSLKEWFRQAEVEAGHFAKHRAISTDSTMPLVVVKHRGQSTGKAWVITTLEQYFGEL